MSTDTPDDGTDSDSSADGNSATIDLSPDPPTVDSAFTTADMEGAIAEALESDEDELSHVELNPQTFHASTIGHTRRKMLISKCGLETHNVGTLGTFKTGELIHEWLERNLELDGAEMELPVETTTDGIRFVGTADCVDHENNMIFDFKSRASWHQFNPPVQRHIDQVLVYMKCLGFSHGKIVYISKKDLEVRTWPQEGAFQFDPDRYKALVKKAQSVRDAIIENGIPMQAEDIPFEKGNNWISQQEELRPWMRSD